MTMTRTDYYKIFSLVVFDIFIVLTNQFITAFSEYHVCMVGILVTIWITRLIVYVTTFEVLSRYERDKVFYSWFNPFILVLNIGAVLLTIVAAILAIYMA